MSGDGEGLNGGGHQRNLKRKAQEEEERTETADAGEEGTMNGLGWAPRASEASVVFAFFPDQRVQERLDYLKTLGSNWSFSFVNSNEELVKSLTKQVRDGVKSDVNTDVVALIFNQMEPDTLLEVAVLDQVRKFHGPKLAIFNNATDELKRKLAQREVTTFSGEGSLKKVLELLLQYNFPLRPRVQEISRLIKGVHSEKGTLEAGSDDIKEILDFCRNTKLLTSGTKYFVTPVKQQSALKDEEKIIMYRLTQEQKECCEVLVQDGVLRYRSGGLVTIGTDYNDKSAAKQDRAIFLIAENESIYLANDLDGFHHTSFREPKAIGAGELQVENGRLRWISPSSGHFCPDNFFHLQAQVFFQERGCQDFELHPRPPKEDLESPAKRTKL